MRPNEFYALPALSSEPWHDSYGLIEVFFADGMLEHELDRKAAAEAGSGDVAFEQKLYHNGDGNRIVAYTACLWRGTPIGIVVQAGRGGTDVKQRVVTDLDGYRAAKAYLDAWKDPGNDADGDLAAADAEIPVLSGVYGYRISAGPSGDTRLVPATLLDAEGRLLFDEAAFRTAFDAIVRPAFTGRGRPTGKGSEFDEGIHGKRMRAVATEAVRGAVPPGLPVSLDFSTPPWGPDRHRRLDWIAVLVRTDEGTYGIGLPNYAYATGFAWASSLQGERLGGPEAFDACARDVVAAAGA